MTDTEKKKYIRAVGRRLNLPPDVKKRIMTDFVSAIQSRQDAGKTDEEIYGELGTPAAAAADLNEQMKEFAYVKSPWRWAFFALILLGATALLYGGGIGLTAAILSAALAGQDVGIIGGADGPTAIFVTQARGPAIWQIAAAGAVLLAGVIGFYCLGRRRKK